MNKTIKIFIAITIVGLILGLWQVTDDLILPQISSTMAVDQLKNSSEGWIALMAFERARKLTYIIKGIILLGAIYSISKLFKKGKES